MAHIATYPSPSQATSLTCATHKHLHPLNRRGLTRVYISLKYMLKQQENWIRFDQVACPGDIFLAIKT